MAESVGAARPGGRTARTRAAVAAALQEELLEVGYGGTTMDRIARRAGVAKTTVYRRWGSVGQLVVELFAEAARIQIPVPDTGSLEGDLRELARSAVAVLTDPRSRAVFDVVVREAVHDPADIGPALRRARESGLPSLINVWLDSEVYAPGTLNQTMYK